MTVEEMEKCLTYGAECVTNAYNDGCNIVSFGEMGIGNTSASSLWMTCFTNIPLKQCVGAGSGLDNAGNAAIMMIRRIRKRLTSASIIHEEIGKEASLFSLKPLCLFQGKMEGDRTHITLHMLLEKPCDLRAVYHER